MEKHVKAMTYAPKVPAVRAGECRQTIRIGNKVSEGDEILWYGWECLPCRGKCAWTMRAIVIEVIPILIDCCCGICDHHEDGGRWCKWDSDYVNALAAEDFIFPPTGAELRAVLADLNNTKLRFESYQIIRW